MLFAEKLRQLRDAAGLSEARLAQLSGVTFATIHGYGLSRRKPSFPNVLRIASALGVTCEAFADCEDMQSEEMPTDVPPAKPKGRPRKADAPPTDPPVKRKGKK